jgi:hypothetical protein
MLWLDCCRVMRLQDASKQSCGSETLLRIRIRLINEFRIRIRLSKSYGSSFGSDLFPQKVLF